MTAVPDAPPRRPDDRRCPTCGRAAGPAQRRCRYCLGELTPVLDAGSADARPPDPHERAAPGDRPERVRARLLVVVAGLALLSLGFNVVHGLFGSPGPLPRPSSARGVALTPATWPMANGDASAQRSAASAPALDAPVAWERALDVEIVTAPVVDDSRLYLAAADGRLLALAAESGAELWSVDLGARLWGAPTVAGDALYLAMRSGDVLALDAATGAPRWRVATDGSFFTAPAVFAGVVYVHDQGDLFGFDAEDGRRLWATHTGARQSGSQPVVAGRWLVIATSDGVHVFDRLTGEHTFDYPQAQVVTLAARGPALVSVSPSFVTTADATTRSYWWEGARGVWTQAWLWGFAPAPPVPPVRWYSDTSPTDANRRVAATGLLAPAIADGQIVVAHANGLVRAFADTDGRLAWEHRFPAIAGAPTATASGIVVPLPDAVVVLATDDGAEFARRPLSRADARDVIVVAGGTYIFDRAGRVVALR